MLLEYQISICDARDFQIDKRGKYSKPTWPLPLEGRHFQKYFGPVRTRYSWRVGKVYYSDEGYYARSINAAKVDELHKYSFSIFNGPQGLSRRLFSDGATNIHFNIGTKIKNWDRQLKIKSLNNFNWFELIGDFLSLKVRVRSCNGGCKHKEHISKRNYKRPTHLYKIPPSITALFRCSTRSGNASEKDTQALVRFGDSCAFIKYTDQDDRFYFNHKNIERIHPDFYFFYTKWISKSRDGSIPVFILNTTGISERDAISIRTAVKRYFSEGCGSILMYPKNHIGRLCSKIAPSALSLK